MNWLLGKARVFAGFNDSRDAYLKEEARVKRASAVPVVDPRFAEDLCKPAGCPHTAPLGTAFRAPDLPVALRLAAIAGGMHGLVLGGTGSGKTYLVLLMIRALLRRFARKPREIGAVILDPKDELAPRVTDLIGALADELPSKLANALIDALVVIDPFSRSALVPLQILKPEHGVSPEEQAFEAATVIERVGGADLGVRQDGFLFHLLLLAITSTPALTLVDLVHLIGDALALATRAASSSSLAVRTYFSVPRLSETSLQGVASRLYRILRLPSTRLMLGAKDCISFREVLGFKILVVNTGSPPLGCEDLGRMFSGWLTLKVMRACFERTEEDAKRGIACFVDEWAECLAAGGGIADDYERVLQMARARGVSFWLISQSLASAAKVSASLPKVVATNCDIQCLFKASPEDARLMGHLLPTTGRRLAERPLPWQERSHAVYLSRDAELQLLQAEVSALPKRVFYLWNREYKAELVRTADLEIPAVGFRSAADAARLRDGSRAVPIAKLEAEALDHEAALAATIATDPQTATPPPRRRRRPTQG